VSYGYEMHYLPMLKPIERGSKTACGIDIMARRKGRIQLKVVNVSEHPWQVSCKRCRKKAGLADLNGHA
jgi:hypothetical protein